MTINISDFIKQKFTELQSNVPVNLNLTSDKDSSFSDTLSNELNSNSNNTTTAPNISTDKPNLTPTNTAYNALSYSSALKAANINNITSSSSQKMDRITNAINLSAQKYNLDPNLIKAVIRQESDFDQYSLSSSGAQGLMQLMPGTAEGLGVNDAWNIEENIDGGSRYLAEQLKDFDGNITLALAAYNAGPGSVRKYNGVPPYAETMDYTKKVEKYYDEYKNNIK